MDRSGVGCRVARGNGPGGSFFFFYFVPLLASSFLLPRFYFTFHLDSFAFYLSLEG